MPIGLLGKGYGPTEATLPETGYQWDLHMIKLTVFAYNMQHGQRHKENNLHAGDDLETQSFEIALNVFNQVQNCYFTLSV